MKESHIINRQLGPLSAVAIHRLSSLMHMQEITLRWPCRNGERKLGNMEDAAQPWYLERLGPHRELSPFPGASGWKFYFWEAEAFSSSHMSGTPNTMLSIN